MNGNGTVSKIETFNQSVRAIVTLGITAGFIWLALHKDLDSGVYTNVFTMIVTFWFVSRQQQSRAGDAAPAPSPPGGAGVDPTNGDKH